MAFGGEPCPYMDEKNRRETLLRGKRNIRRELIWELDVWIYGSIPSSRIMAAHLWPGCDCRGARHSGGNKTNVCPQNQANYKSASAEVPGLPAARPLPNPPSSLGPCWCSLQRWGGAPVCCRRLGAERREEGRADVGGPGDLEYKRGIDVEANDW